jgi:crossover junction endonuclease MUS81
MISLEIFNHNQDMNIIVDNREKGLVKLLNAYKFMYEMEHINIQIEQLPIGDIIIKDRDTNNEERIVFERKHVSDLASSIVDGRYKEQPFRLDGSCPLSNHNIIYIIEGSIASLNSKFTKVKPAALYSAICSLQYFKGFSVMKTSNMEETCEYILRMADKIHREKPTTAYYANKGETSQSQTQQQQQAHSPQEYSDVVKRVKKDNITPENIGVIMLSQVPGVSVAMAKGILSERNKTLLEFVEECRTDPTYLTNIELGNGRKLTRTAVENIKKYLLREKEIIINVIDEQTN